MVTQLHAALGTTGVPLRLRRPPVLTKPTPWRRYFPMAAVVLLIVTLLGASFSTFVPDDDGDQFASVRPVVLGVAMPRVLTAEKIAELWGCGYDRDVPVVVTKSDHLSAYNEAMRFNPDFSAAAVKCHDQFVELIVLKNTEVVQTSYPGIVFIDTGSAVSALNLKSMKAIQLQSDMTIDEIQRFNSSTRSSRWLIIRDEDLVIDTWTMDVIALNGILGATTDRFLTVSVDASDDGQLLVAAVHNLEEGDAQTQFVTINREHQSTVVTTPTDPLGVQGLTVSPDGTHAAYRSSGDQGIFSVVDLATGEETDQIEIPGDLHTSDPVWVNDSTFVFTNHGALLKATLGSTETETLYEEPGTSLAIYKTRDANTVTLVQRISNTSPEPFVGADARIIITVNTETGDTKEFIGVDQALSPDQAFVFTRNVILLETEPNQRSGGELNVQVIDPVTGEEIGMVDREDVGLRDGAVRSGGGTSDGDMRFFSWGSLHTYQLTTNDGTTILEQIPPPPGVASETDMAVGIRTGPDSSWIAMHIESIDEWWLLDLTNSDPGWVQLPKNDGVLTINLKP